MAVNAACQHVPCKPLLIALRAIGTVGPNVACRIVLADDILQFATIGSGSRGGRAFADEAETPINADVGSLAKYR